MFDATPGGQKIRTALGTCVADVDRLLAYQERSLQDRRAATAQCRQGRQTLRDAAKAIVTVGRLVTLREPTMSTMQLLGPASDDQLLAYVRGMLDRVAPHAEALVAEGLPPDLLTRLEAGIRRFVAAKDGQASARQGFTVAAVSIRRAQDKADKTIDALDAIAVNTLDADPALLTKLRIARRVGPRFVAEPAVTAALSFAPLTAIRANAARGSPCPPVPIIITSPRGNCIADLASITSGKFLR